MPPFPKIGVLPAAVALLVVLTAHFVAFFWGDRVTARYAAWRNRRRRPHA